MEQKTIALALGGGGARGLAHIGVIKALLQAGIRINFLAGTSMGGIVASGLAAGKSIQDVEELALRFRHLSEIIKLVDLSNARRGLFHHEKVRKYLSSWLGEDLTFEDLKIPLVLNAVDISNGAEVWIQNGYLLPALNATICVPGLFSPVLVNDRWLIDGGVLNNVPVAPARIFQPDIVIAVDVQPLRLETYPWKTTHNSKSHWPVPTTPEFFQDLYQATTIMAAAQTENQLGKCPPDFLIKPDIDQSVTMIMGFPLVEEIIAAGEQAALAQLPQILKGLQSPISHPPADQ